MKFCWCEFIKDTVALSQSRNDKIPVGVTIVSLLEVPLELIGYTTLLRSYTGMLYGLVVYSLTGHFTFCPGSLILYFVNQRKAQLWWVKRLSHPTGETAQHPLRQSTVPSHCKMLPLLLVCCVYVLIMKLLWIFLKKWEMKFHLYVKSENFLQEQKIKFITLSLSQQIGIPSRTIIDG